MAKRNVPYRPSFVVSVDALGAAMSSVRALSVALGLTIALWAGSSVAAGAVLVSLEYAADPGLSCPNAADFKSAVVRHLRSDPFRDFAPLHIVVRIGLIDGRMEGRVMWRDSKNEWERERSLASHTETCAELSRAMALTTAIQIQLFAMRDAPGGPEAEPELQPQNKAVIEATPKVAAVVPVRPASNQPRPARWAIGASAAVVQDAGNGPIFTAPRLAFVIGPPSALAVRVAVTGLGPSAEVKAPGGKAEMNRLAATVQLIEFFRPDKRIQPLLAIGAGVQDIRIRGISAMPSEALAHDGQVLSGLIVAGGGLAFTLASHVLLVAEADAMFFEPAVTVRIGSVPRAAWLNGAALSGSGGVLARF